MLYSSEMVYYDVIMSSFKKGKVLQHPKSVLQYSSYCYFCYFQIYIIYVIYVIRLYRLTTFLSYNWGAG